MSTHSTLPVISPMRWVPARDVLGHEAHDFTPWLAANIDLLAETLGLDTLELEATEWKVESFALDVLARGSDADGEVTVVIENQYGATDHRHLGQLLTYAAHAAARGGRVLAVWLIEEVRPAHLAAVEFLNRVAAEGAVFGIVLLRVRFAPAPEGWHVHFEVESAPNAFLTQPSPGTSRGGSRAGVTKAEFIDAVASHLDPVLQTAGMHRRSEGLRRHGAAAYQPPAGTALAKLATARVVCAAQTTNVGLYLQRYTDPVDNWAAAEVLRRHYEPLIDEYRLRVDAWHTSGLEKKRDRVLTRLAGGYANSSPAEIATQAGDVLTAWARMLTDHPIGDFEQQVTELAADAGEPGGMGDDDAALDE